MFDILSSISAKCWLEGQTKCGGILHGIIAAVTYFHLGSITLKRKVALSPAFFEHLKDKKLIQQKHFVIVILIFFFFNF